MSFTRIAICSLTLVAAGVGCQRDRNDSQGEPYSRAVDRGASDFDRSMAPTGTTASGNTRGGTSMTTGTPIGGSQSSTGAGTTGTGSIPPASTASRSGTSGKNQTTDQDREARRGLTKAKRSKTQATDTKATDTKATDTKAKASDTGASSGDKAPTATNPSTNDRPER